jgi:hypothetical protein
VKVNEKAEAFEKLQKAIAPLLPSTIPIANIPQGNVPSEIILTTEQPAMTIHKMTRPLALDDSSLEGKIAIVYSEGKLPKDRWFTVTDLTRAFQSHGWNRDPRASAALDKFCHWGYFEKQLSGRRPDYRVRLAPEDARSKGLIKEVKG